MNYDSIAAKGCPPWLPNSRAADLEPFHLHDIPLIGTFRMGDVPVLFVCLSGYARDTNVWAYLPLAADEAQELSEAEPASLGELQVTVLDMFTGHRAAFAYARYGKITDWSAEDVEADGVMSAAIRFMDNNLNAEAAQIAQVKQARVDATMRVLAPA